MRNKITIVVLMLFGLELAISAQTAAFDSMRYYYNLPKIDVYDVNNIVLQNTWEYSITNTVIDLQKWSKEKKYSKGVIAIRVNADDEKMSLSLYKMFTTWSFYNTGFPYPDYYSYIDSVPVFWYFGAYKFVSPPVEYKQFIKAKLAKYLYDNLTPFGWFYDDSKNEFVLGTGEPTRGDEPLQLYPEHQEWLTISPVYELYPDLSNLRQSHNHIELFQRKILNSTRF